MRIWAFSLGIQFGGESVLNSELKGILHRPNELWLLFHSYYGYIIYRRYYPDALRLNPITDPYLIGTDHLDNRFTTKGVWPIFSKRIKDFTLRVGASLYRKALGIRLVKPPAFGDIVYAIPGNYMIEVLKP